MARRKTPETEPLADPVDAPVDGSLAEPAERSEPEASVQPADPQSPSEPEPETVPPPLAAPAGSSAAGSRWSGVLGTLLGGALAAGAGFGLSHFNAFGFSAKDPGAALADLEQRLNEGLAQLRVDQAALAAVQSDLAALAERITSLETAGAPETADLSAIDTAIDDLARRLAVIEALPAGNGEASVAALAARLAELEGQLANLQAVDQAALEAALARLSAAEAEAARRAAEAAAAAATAARALALDQLRAAVAAGGGFEAELAALNDPDLTTRLQAYTAGVATLASLQADFPDAARQVLQLARKSAGSDGWGERIVDFLAAQTGARSLTPRDGLDPDAILSRAEFALAEGRLADALSELGALSDPLRAPLADWIARAEARLAVQTALEGL
jgi:hypothetical protein